MMSNQFKSYYAVIFTSIKSVHDDGYSIMAEKMVILAQQQPGFIGIESARDEIGITVSYWENEVAILAWKKNVDHLEAQLFGQNKWYDSYKVRICKVEREYAFHRDTN
jgi:heme-degrading monooxygenase HmoA